MKEAGKNNKLKIFIAYSSNDRLKVEKLYQKLVEFGHTPWLDVKNILPGQEWSLEIRKALRNSHVVLICLSSRATTKAGYFQKEIKSALDISKEQPEGTIFIVPVMIEECVVPESLKSWQWVKTFEEDSYDQLWLSLLLRAEYLGLIPQPFKKIPVESGNPLEGRYEVRGTNDEGQIYTGIAFLTVRDKCFYLMSHIGPNVHLCRGSLIGNTLHVYGDFDVVYRVNEDKSLEGAWGKKGTEKLIPTD